MLPSYATTIALIALTINHTKTAPPALTPVHNTVFEYCSVSLPLNFLFLNNMVGFGGCGVVRSFFSVALEKVD